MDHAPHHTPTTDPFRCPCGAETVLRIASDSVKTYPGRIYLVCSTPRQHRSTRIQHHWRLVTHAQLLSHLCRIIRFDRTYNSSLVAHRQFAELLPDVKPPDDNVQSRGVLPSCIVPDSSDSDEPDTPLPPVHPPRLPPPYVPPPPEHTFLWSLVPIVALGAASVVPSVQRF